MTYMHQLNADITMDTPVIRDVSFRSGAHVLKGRLYHPGKPPEAVVIINAATGVRQRFYTDFATWLAEERGLACVTYDYRDFGASLACALPDTTASMVDWLVHDPAAVRGAVSKMLPGTPIWHLGHSIGGMGLPFQETAGEIDRVITVASGPVHLRDHPWPYRALAAAFWYGPAPIATKLLGYMPGRALKVGPDLPAKVYWQWRKWCTSVGFFTSDIGAVLPYPDWKAATCPMRVVAVSDDDLVPPAAVWRVMDFYRASRKTQKVLKPADYDLTKIGHVGMFAPQAKACWDDILG